jgi:hypothetical protein
MTTTELDSRIKRLEVRLNKAESVLDAGTRVLETIEQAHERAARARENPFVLMGVGLLALVSVALVARRQLAR